MTPRPDACGAPRPPRASAACVAGVLAACAAPVAGIAAHAWAQAPRPGWQAALAYGAAATWAVLVPALLRAPWRIAGPGPLIAAGSACLAAGLALDAAAGLAAPSPGGPRPGIHPAFAAFLLLPWLALLTSHHGSVRTERRRAAEALLLLGASGRRVWRLIAGPGERFIAGSLLLVLAAAALGLRGALLPPASAAENPEALFGSRVPAALLTVAVEAAAGFLVLREIGLRTAFPGGRMPEALRADSPAEFRAGPPPAAPGGSPGVFEARPDESLTRGFADGILDPGDGEPPGPGQ